MEKNRTEKMEKAFKMGIEAFENGMKCVPAHDKNLMDIATIKDVPFFEVCTDSKYAFEKEENDATVKAWIQGWTFANIGAGA